MNRMQRNALDYPCATHRDVVRPELMHYIAPFDFIFAVCAGEGGLAGNTEGVPVWYATICLRGPDGPIALDEWNQKAVVEAHALLGQLFAGLKGEIVEEGDGDVNIHRRVAMTPDEVAQIKSTPLKDLPALDGNVAKGRPFKERQTFPWEN